MYYVFLWAEILMGKVRFLALVWACAFYGYFVLIVLRGEIPKLFR